MLSTHRDLVITDLANENYALQTRLCEAESDAQIQHELACAALDYISRVDQLVRRQTKLIDQQRETIRELTGINRNDGERAR